MDNRHIPYLNAIIAADIKGKAKFTLTFLIDNMDFDTKETYIGQTALAKKMGVSYDSAAAGIDLLEKEKLIEAVGIQPTHPGSLLATTKYRILLEPLQEISNELTIGNSPTGGESAVGKNPTVGKKPSNLIQSTGGVDVSKRSERMNAVEKPHTYTNPGGQSNSQSDTETDQNLRFGTSRENPKGHPFWEGNFSYLVEIFEHLTVGEKHWSVHFEQLERYKGNISPVRLAQLMFWAFRLSAHWKNPDTWGTLDMENFLRASVTMNNQAEKFPRSKNWLKQFPTVESVLEWCIGEEERKIARGEKKGKTFSAVGGASECQDQQ